jgi:dTDP-4-amino-4,6-dideoxygalactose transaminase
MCGARPVFADVDRDSQNILAASIDAALAPATRAMIAVGLAGWRVRWIRFWNSLDETTFW